VIRNATTEKRNASVSAPAKAGVIRRGKKLREEIARSVAGLSECRRWGVRCAVTTLAPNSAANSVETGEMWATLKAAAAGTPWATSPLYTAWGSFVASPITISEK